MSIHAKPISPRHDFPKPHPDGVYQAAKRMELSTPEIMVVGDFRLDVMAAKAAGACAVLLTNRGESVMTPAQLSELSAFA